MSRLKRKDYHHGDLRNALVEAAASLIVEKGIDNVSLREVARKAGVSHAAPYHHFSNKYGLLAAVAEEGFSRFNGYQERAFRMARTKAPVDRLKALGHAYVRFAIANPSFFRIMFRYDISDPYKHPLLRALSKKTFDRLFDTVSEGLKANNQSVDPMEHSIRAWALVHGLATLWLDGRLEQMPDAKQIVDKIIDQSIYF
jgi:AcrR family transcriptional regulator